MANRIPIAILGAGPAGLGAALCLARRGSFDVSVLERAERVGGNAGSFEIEQIPVDYGSHRLHPACSPEILNDIRALLGDDLLIRPRHGRIHLRGRWVHFPLKPLNLAARLPPSFLLGVAKDAVWKKAATNGSPSFASELQKGLGETICRDFYFPYARKIWGSSPWDLNAEQARRRVSANSLGKMVYKALAVVPGLRKSMSGKFYYPRKGFGQICESYAAAARRAGVDIRLGTTVCQVEASTNGPVKIRVQSGTRPGVVAAKLVLSTIPITQLAEVFRPAPPRDVLASSSSLSYRSMLLVYLALDSDRFSEYDAHYFPGEDISITRLSEPKNYGLAESPGKTVLCAELPCTAGDELWNSTDDDLKSQLLEDLARAGLPVRAPICGVVVRRLKYAYPIYTRDYFEHFQRLDRWADRLDGVVSLGRQGLFAHDNTHHTLAMAYAASDCLSPQGEFNYTSWAQNRAQFETHVVED